MRRGDRQEKKKKKRNGMERSYKEMATMCVTMLDPRFTPSAVIRISFGLKQQQSVLKSDMEDISNAKIIYLYKSFHLMPRLLS